ncbi:helix-turn-helix transcriptional regulator [Vibrio sp. SCSIO 43135]|uniref:helix-turn-helix transcriptional regulator n=1 Tax=Vibrio sp. SCSIO 43135 TaxID=2819096 RepID=UPI002075B620|nr:helix-turn-helix transcriptional regulator [Vibrio sp. SCSIO 43135]USD43470.1 helix-turn-helix transcriptional regulator [Vibrio sp. SCSIO 43135]
MSTTVTPDQLSLFQQLPGYWGCKDLNSVFVYANQAYADLIGVEKPSDCIGRTDFEMPSATRHCAADFQAQDKYVMETRQSIKVLDIHPYPDGSWHAHIFTKSPWLDEHGEIKGTIFYGQELTNTAVLEIGHWICRATGLEGDHSEPMTHNSPKESLIEPLTAREAEVLFLLLYGKKPKHIARVMNISIKTFESYVVRLRGKFSAHSKEQLIDRALDLGYGSAIPKTMLKTQLSVVLTNEYAAD